MIKRFLRVFVFVGMATFSLTHVFAQGQPLNGDTAKSVVDHFFGVGAKAFAKKGAQKLRVVDFHCKTKTYYQGCRSYQEFGCTFSVLDGVGSVDQNGEFNNGQAMAFFKTLKSGGIEGQNFKNISCSISKTQQYSCVLINQ